jgi:hypothetical protein
MHTKRDVNLIGNQEFIFAGKNINIHDVVSVQIEGDKIKAIYTHSEKWLENTNIEEINSQKQNIDKIVRSWVMMQR